MLINTRHNGIPTDPLSFSMQKSSKRNIPKSELTKPFILIPTGVVILLQHLSEVKSMFMFKEILVFMLWLQFSNGSLWEVGSGIIEDKIGKVNKGTSCKENAIEFLEETYYVAGGTIPATFSKICILSNHQGEDIKEPPAALSQTRIYVEISEIQIKRIRKYSMEIKFYFKVKWVDQRLQVLQFQFTPDDYPFILQESEQESIWIPPLKLTSMISNGVDVDYVQAGPRILGNFTSGAWVAQSNYVNAEVECELDFKTFPFDHHVCRIEVRIY